MERIFLLVDEEIDEDYGKKNGLLLYVTTSYIREQDVDDVIDYWLLLLLFSSVVRVNIDADDVQGNEERNTVFVVFALYGLMIYNKKRIEKENADDTVYLL